MIKITNGKTLWKDISRGKNPPKQINVVVEIPRRSRNKIEYQEREGYFKLDRVIFSPFHYPGDYGFIPQTISEDGDALDTLLLTEEPTFPGCVVEARPIGVLRMEDEKGIDDKVLAAPMKDPRKADYRDIKSVNKHKKQEIAHFFSDYKELEESKWAKVKEWLGAKKAHEQVKRAMDKYDEEEK